MNMSGRIVLALFLSAGQATPPVANVPTFEDIMVVLNDSHENRVSFNYIRGRLYVMNSTLRMLIRTSYGVQDSQIVGGPEWMSVDRFDIGARGDVGNSPALPVAHAGDPSRLQLMMQSLLADHFKLVVHRETQESDVYELTLLNGDRRLGPGLRHSDIDCEALASHARQGNSRTSRPVRRCDLSRDVGSLAIDGRPLSQLANTLSMMVGKTVVDQTGLTGNFNLHLAWTPDRTSPPASFLTAVREQLGLELVLRKRSTEVLVVDRADRRGIR
jgi:uncharacterized protein (TIGR03435 family)